MTLSVTPYLDVQMFLDALANNYLLYNLDSTKVNLSPLYNFDVPIVRNKRRFYIYCFGLFSKAYSLMKGPTCIKFWIKITAMPRLMSKWIKLPGNALARVQRVHEPVDLWDITFCTQRFKFEAHSINKASVVLYNKSHL